MHVETLMVERSSDSKKVSVEFNPFAGPEIVRLAPITDPQAEIWLACLLGGEDASRAYNESLSLEFTGPLDRAAMQQALQEVINRHESLRSAFSADGKFMCVFESIPLAISYSDATTKTTEEKQQLISDLLSQDACHVFNLVQGPLIKAALVKLADNQHHFLLTAHHIICDGWSLGILLQDLGSLYSAYTQNLTPVLPEALKFSEYADEQAAFRSSEECSRTEEFWIKQYQEAVPTLELPTDFPRPALRTYKSARLDYPLANDLVLKVKQTGLKAGCSFVTTLMTCFEVLLHRLTSQEVLVVGLPTAGQSVTENQHLIGHCVNLLPLKSRINKEDKFSDFLRQRKTYIFDAYEHQRLTFGNLLKKINVPRNPSRVPLVPVVFNIDMGLANGVGFYNLDYRLRSNPRAYETFEIFLNASGSENTLVLEWSYNMGLFKPESIDRMMAMLVCLLEEITVDPDIKINLIKLKNNISLPEEYKILNNTAANYPTNQSLFQLISSQSHITPDKAAIKFKEVTLSYQELNSRSNQLARYLTDKNLQPSDTVGILLDRSQELLILLLAVLKCGATYVALDPTYPQDRLAFMMRDSEAKFLITSGKKPRVFDKELQVIFTESALCESAKYSDKDVELSLPDDHIIYILYTSGSTGLPKGVRIRQQSVVNFMYSMQQVPGISAADRVLALTTISFDIAVFELFLPLVWGATVVMAETQAAKDGSLLLELLEKEQITIMQATPTTWRMVLDAGWTKRFPLKIISGGEALTNELAGRLLANCDSLWNMYGPTETTIYSSGKRISRADELITIGKPIANTQLYILDVSLEIVEPGTIGELYIAGAGVAQEYINRPELTKDKFVANSFSADSGSIMYRTGDLSKLLEGEIQYLGRADQQVKIRGYRIEPGEIEYLLTSFDGIKEAVVAAKADSNNTQLAAYIVLSDISATKDIDRRATAWKNKLAEKVPTFMIPSDFIIVESLPKTLNGKIDRAALGRLSKPASSEDAVYYDGPRTDVEQLIADIWKQHLKLSTVGIFDDFFKLGGHSLTAVQVMAQVERQTGKKLPLATLFENSTIEKLASVLQMDSKLITWDSLVPIKPQGTKTPLYIVHGAGLNVLIFNALAKNMDSEQPVYGLQAKGLNGIDEPLESIEEIAAYYISAIQTRNPHGPYALAGYSFGGIIAFEMTKQLQAAGKIVKVLAMFDTYANQSDYFDPMLVRTTTRFIFSIKKLLYLFVLLGKDPKKTLEYKIDSVKRFIDKKVRYSKEKHYENVFGHPYKLGVSQEIASRKYQLTSEQIKVHLFRVKNKTYYMDDFEFLGWKPFALKGVDIHEIPGDHNTMFAPPDDRESGRILQDVLDANQ